MNCQYYNYYNKAYQCTHGITMYGFLGAHSDHSGCRCVCVMVCVFVIVCVCVYVSVADSFSS